MGWIVIVYWQIRLIISVPGSTHFNNNQTLYTVAPVEPGVLLWRDDAEKVEVLLILKLLGLLDVCRIEENILIIS